MEEVAKKTVAIGSSDVIQLLTMSEDTVRMIKNIIVSLEKNLHAHKDRMEKILSNQSELQKRLNDAEERAMEAADLREKYEMVLAENELLKRKLKQG